MNNIRLLSLSLLFTSLCIISFEIIATRISSVIFVNNYAFIILSLAILGIGTGGIFSYYKIKIDLLQAPGIIVKVLICLAISLLVFIIAVTEIQFITNRFIYFFILFIPFFFAGIFYSQVFKIYARQSFKLYASDLTGAAIGSIISIAALFFLGASNAVLLLTLIILIPVILLLKDSIKRKKNIVFGLILFAAFALLAYNGNNEILSRIPIGNLDEKDFYHVYPDPNIKSEIIESRWSIYGRADLVQYNHQDIVKQLFIDGAAGTQMYRFNGNKNKPDKILIDLLIRHSNSIPFLFLNENEKDNMLVIGPGGGKEILMGLFENVKEIRGVEINSDFVDIVKDYKNFNGGIYTNFPNVNILVSEGRHFVKKSDKKYDLIVMALPSTEQMQNIEAFAMSENYLLTVEAMQDYLKALTPEGRLIFTLHNQWELIRLITTVISAFKEIGVNSNDALNHFAILEQEYAPTIVIKNNAFTNEEIFHWQKIINSIPQELPPVTYLPMTALQVYNKTIVNQFLLSIREKKISLEEIVSKHPYDISPCIDDSPYFYKVSKGVPEDYLYLLSGVAVFNLFVVSLPFIRIKKKLLKDKKKNISLDRIIIPLTVFACLGLGFMILEISLFQKLVLYLGSPTISLSILLSSLLIGMGTGSYYGKNIYTNNHQKRLYVFSLFIVFAGTLFFIIVPLILNSLLSYNLFYRGIASFLMMIPFGFLLGIPFPTMLQLLKSESNEELIPWMYGINGTMSVLGSILAVVLSMIYGFTVSFFTGLFFYLVIFILMQNHSGKIRISENN